jgi:rhodanese-related sulfurtransferase
MSNKTMTLDEFFNCHKSLNQDELILDVRRPEEFASGHIENARNIPVDEVAGFVDELRKYSAVYIHCKRGGRAKAAFDALSNAGLSNLVCIHDAGMDKWIESGYPVKH